MLDGLQLLFSDKTVPYKVFMEDLSAMIAVKVNSLKEYPEYISQNKAWSLFKKKRVQDWVSRNLIQPREIKSRKGKVTKYEYEYSKLYLLNKQNA